MTTKHLTIEEIRRLDAEIDKGKWLLELESSVWRIKRVDGVILATEEESGHSMRLLSDGSHQPANLMLMAAAPQIAKQYLELYAKCVQLEEENERLRERVEKTNYLISYSASLHEYITQNNLGEYGDLYSDIAVRHFKSLQAEKTWLWEENQKIVNSALAKLGEVRKENEQLRESLANQNSRGINEPE